MLGSKSVISYALSVATTPADVLSSPVSLMTSQSDDVKQPALTQSIRERQTVITDAKAAYAQAAAASKRNAGIFIR